MRANQGEHEPFLARHKLIRDIGRVGLSALTFLGVAGSVEVYTDVHPGIPTALGVLAAAGVYYLTGRYFDRRYGR